MKVIVENNREWEHIPEPEKVIYLLTNKLIEKNFYLKRSTPPEVFSPEFNKEDKEFVYNCASDLNLPPKITLYATLKRQLEIDFEVVRNVSPGSPVLKPTAARIGKTNRAYPRIVNPDGSVTAAHFLISKSEITIDNTRPQIANKVIFSEFERKLATEFPGLKIYDYADKTRPEVTTFLNKSDRSILVENTSEPDSFGSQGPEFEDYRSLLMEEEKFDRVRHGYVDSLIKSVVALPILIETPTKDIPIAYIHYEAREGAGIDLDGYQKLKGIVDDILKRIGDASTMKVEDRQAVANISEGGISLELTHPDLIKYVPHQKYITFDLVFRLQAPMRFSGKVVHALEQDGKCFVGVDLAGSAHTDLKKGNRERLHSLINMSASKTQ